MKTRLSVVFAVAALFGATYAQDNPPETVDELDINLYLGLWYQVHIIITHCQIKDNGDLYL